MKKECVEKQGFKKARRRSSPMKSRRKSDCFFLSAWVIVLAAVSQPGDVVVVAFPSWSGRSAAPRNLQLVPTSTRRDLTKHQLSTAAASLLSGSVAGVIGIGLSFPLDTVNTRFQLVQGEQEGHRGKGSEKIQGTDSINGIADMARQIYQTDGWQGFFAGAKGMMAGESVIKAVAFASNAIALATIEASSSSSSLHSSPLALFVAACFAGMMAAFVVTPVERIKVVMQASPKGTFKDELDCAQTIFRQQGVRGLLHGLDATLARDIPGYGLYFAIYGMLNQHCDAGLLSPVIFGATAGSASWIPVYPIDTVKTLMQRSMDHSSAACMNAWQVMAQLYARGGAMAFYQGLTPKLLRSAVNHATTFTVYESAMQALAHSTQ